MNIPVALIQFDAVPERVERNLEEMERLVREAAGLGARWVMFHEGTLTDYTQRLDELAEEVPDGGSTLRMIDLAGELDCLISFGLSEKLDGRFHITQAFVGPSGLIHAYRKTWLWRTEKDEGYRNEWARYDPGPGPEPFDLDGFRATCFICADGEAPRCIDRAAALRPDVVFFPNNRGSLPEFALFGQRAKRLGAPMLVTNRVGRSWVYDCKGGCVVYSSNGNVLARANRVGEEEILFHNLRIKKGS
jgi:predicted amidohydrolase